MTEPAIQFDYSILDEETRDFAERAAEAIYGLAKRSARDVIEIGTLLVEAKQRLGHGRFLPWIEAEFGWTDRMARHLMRVAEAFKSEKISDLDSDPALGFDPSALYALSAPSVPEEARQEAVEQAKNGHVSHKDAKRIIAAKKPSANGKPPAPAGGKSRVNGELVDDPPDIAAARAAGKIAPDVIPDITDPGPEATAAESEPPPAPGEDDLDDEEWLDSLPLRAKLDGACRRWFETQALAYRQLDPARQKFTHPARQTLAWARRRGGKGPYTFRVGNFIRMDHPKHWHLCPTPEHGGCGGAGTIDLLGECPKCHGAGFWIK